MDTAALMNGIAALAKLIILVGMAVVVLGLVILLLSRLTGGRWAPLPGDIVIRRDGVSVYLPIVTCLVASIIVSLLFFLVGALRR